MTGQREWCPRCGLDVLVKNDGTLRKHTRFEPGEKYGRGPRWVACEGSGQKGAGKVE